MPAAKLKIFWSLKQLIAGVNNVHIRSFSLQEIHQHQRSTMVESSRTGYVSEREVRQALTLVTTGSPLSDRCLSTYAEDSRSLQAERRVKRLLTLAKSCVPPTSPLIQASIILCVRWAPAFILQSFRALERLIMTSTRWTRLFPACKHNYTHPAPETNMCLSI